MNHKLEISVSKGMKDGIVSCKKVSIREKILRKLLGPIRRLTILVSGDTVEEVTIIEKEGASDDE